MTFKKQEKTRYQAAAMHAHLEQIQLDKSVSDLQQSAPETMDSSYKNWNSLKSMSQQGDKCWSASNLCYENQVTEIGSKKRDTKFHLKAKTRAQHLADLQCTTQSYPKDAHVGATTPQQSSSAVGLSPDTLMLLLQISSIESSEAAQSKQLQEQVAQILSQRAQEPRADNAKELSDTRNGQECADLSTDSRTRALEVSNLDCTLNGDKIPGSGTRRSKKRFLKDVGPVKNLEGSQDSSRDYPESPRKRLRGEEIIAQYVPQNNAIKRQNMDFEHFKTVVRTHGKFWPGKSSMTKRLRETKKYLDTILQAEPLDSTQPKEQPYEQNPSHLSRKNPPQIIKALEEMDHLINSDVKQQIHQSQSQINGMSQEQSSNYNTINQKQDLILLNTFKQLEAKQKSILAKNGDEGIASLDLKQRIHSGISCAEMPSKPNECSGNSALPRTQDNTPTLPSASMKPGCQMSDDVVDLNFVNDLFAQVGTEENLNTLLSKIANADADATSADHVRIHQGNSADSQPHVQSATHLLHDLSTPPVRPSIPPGQMDIGEQAEALVNVIQNMMTQIVTNADPVPILLKSNHNTELSPSEPTNNQNITNSSTQEVDTDLLVALKRTLESLGDQLAK